MPFFRWKLSQNRYPTDKLPDQTDIQIYSRELSEADIIQPQNETFYKVNYSKWDPTEAVMRKKKIQTEVHIIQPQHVQSQSLPWLRFDKEKKYSASTLRIMSISSSLLNGSLLKPYMLPRVCNNHNENVILYYRDIEYCNIG